MLYNGANEQIIIFLMNEQVIFDHIQSLINDNHVVLFMKGTKKIPMCGFSSIIVKILNHLDIDFLDIHVLENNDLREGIKKYSDWPTIPQLYINQEFVGGCDIVKDLYSNGTLKQMLEPSKISSGL